VLFFPSGIRHSRAGGNRNALAVFAVCTGLPRLIAAGASHFSLMKKDQKIKAWI